MGRGGKVGGRHNRKREVRSRDKGSDDSDEDYMVEEDDEVEVSDSLDEYCSDASEESFGGLKEEEARKVNRLKGKNGSKILAERSQEKKWVSYDDDDVDDRKEEEEEEDDDDDDDDEEFTPEEVDGIDEEEEVPVKNNNKKKSSGKKVGRKPWQKNVSKGGRKRKRNSAVIKKPTAKEGRKIRRMGRKASSDNDGEFKVTNQTARQTGKKNPDRRRRKFTVRSDSDFVTSESSDCEFTISEEEREQVREASQFCRSLTTSLRSSSSLKKIQEESTVIRQRKPVGRKGKEKMEDSKNEIAKQVCGICLSEEGKRTVRGTLNCCSHYFCFACIIEWSKVESRCPLCKQRFVTISKPARLNAGVDLRNVVIPIPERDQVYQPSEEELNVLLDPYEHVICTECHQGGDDSLMLLCDLCDSPAHTYCVGLGREVPEGNWYCEGCRPVALRSSSFRAQDPLPEQRTASSNLSSRPSPIEIIRETLEFTLAPSPRTPTRGIGINNSPRYSGGDAHTASPVSGAGPSTLSGRRWIHRHIHHILSSGRMSHMAGRTDGNSAANLTRDFLNSQIELVREPSQPRFQHSRTPEVGTSHHTLFEERSRNSSYPFLQNNELFPTRLSLSGRQVVSDATAAGTDGSLNGASRTDLLGVNLNSNSHHLHQCGSRSNIGSDGSLPLYTLAGGNHFCVAKEQLLSIVQGHLQSLSTNIELDYFTFKDIARSSTHTILATCGLELRTSEAYPMEPPSVCPHIEMVAGGQVSLMKGCCSACFDSFIRSVVLKIMETKLSL